MSGEELRAREGDDARGDGRRASEEGLAGSAAASVPGGGAWRLAYVTDLELPHPLDAAGRDACLRRLSALFLDDACARRGGLGRVTRAVNATGEPFAVKALVLPDDGPGDPARRAEIVRRAFDEEYESQRRLVGLEGFPQLYGRGMVDGKPVIVMEWVEGETLEHAARALAVDDDGRLSPLTAARLGRDLFELLVRMDQKAGGLAHRDLSPANVMVRTRELPLADQAEAGAFDLRIVDFGSSALAQRRETSLTEGFGAPRGATPDYAPPEMLTDDVPQAPHARVSPAVDVYAAASVVYGLACGRPPFDLGAEGEVRSPYRCKTEDAPAPLRTAHDAAPDLAAVLRREPEVAAAAASASDEGLLRAALASADARLGAVILPCLAVDQAARPSAVTVRDGLAALCRDYADLVRRALGGGPPDLAPAGGAPCDGGGCVLPGFLGPAEAPASR